jgi:uncharacterized membrane protein
LFPKQSELDLVSRVALSFGLSLAIVPVIALSIDRSPWLISLLTIIGSLCVWAAIGALLLAVGLGLYGYSRRRASRAS